MANPPRVAMIDYGSGNLRSVEKALQHAGADVLCCDSPEPFDSCAAIVLPGVGSFGDCARSLDERGLTEPLRAWLASDRPYLGICLGYQILFGGSEESPEARGLAHWPGKVVRFPARRDLKVPHMGWNALEWRARDSIYTGISDPVFVYFVHSYYPEPAEPAAVTAVCTHGVPFAASCRRGNVRGMQFHPEKSQQTGLRMLENFVGELRGGRS